MSRLMPWYVVSFYDGDALRLVFFSKMKSLRCVGLDGVARRGVGGRARRGTVHATTQATATTTATILSDYFGIIINQIIQYYEQ